MRSARLALSLVVFAVALPAAAEPVTDRIEAARQLYEKGELAGAAGELQVAMEAIHQRLGEALMPLMPEAPEGWQAFQPQADNLGIVGGGMTVMRGYERDEASMTASVILDSEAVSGISEMLATPAVLTAQPGMSLVTVNGQPALLRWDAEDRSGEIMMVVGGRMLLQVVATGIESSDLLVEMLRRFDLAAIGRQAGL